MPGIRHVHRYVKSTLGKNKWPIYKCDLPDCSHYVAEELAYGKYSICHRCGERFILSKSVGHLVKPYCNNCKTRQELPPEKQKIVDSILDDLFNDIAGSEPSVVTSVTEETNDDLDDDDWI